MAASTSNIQPDDDVLIEMYRRMLLIRKSEEQLFRDVKLGRTPGQVHLSDGQEAVAVGICAPLDDRDQITSTHRGHGHYLAKGGDGAANQGSLMECLNKSSLWRLPVLFVRENNGFSEFSHSGTVTCGVIPDRAKPFGIPVRNIDGNDVVQVWRTAFEAVDHCRSGAGPAFIEARTYRYSGHFSVEAMILSSPHRSDEEIEAWRAKDPVARARALIIDRGAADAAACDRMEMEADACVEGAVAFGEVGTVPDPGTAKRLMRVGS